MAGGPLSRSAPAATGTRPAGLLLAVGRLLLLLGLGAAGTPRESDEAWRLPTLKTDDAALPSFLFILGDDIGWADMGYSGGTAHTPHIDALANAEGSIRMMDFHSVRLASLGPVPQLGAS